MSYHNPQQIFKMTHVMEGKSRKLCLFSLKATWVLFNYWQIRSAEKNMIFSRVP